jgi:hypothetical protein
MALSSITVSYISQKNIYKKIILRQVNSRTPDCVKVNKKGGVIQAFSKYKWERQW